MRGPIAIALFLCVLLGACSPQERLNRLVDNNPELKVTDTIKDTVTVTEEEIDIDTGFKADKAPTLDALDSLFDKYRKEEGLDTTITNKVERNVRTIVEKKSPLSDTVRKHVDGIDIALYPQGSGIGVNVHRPERERQEPITRTVERIKKVEGDIPTYYKFTFWVVVAMIAAIFVGIVLRIKNIL